jgi:hypothetical protein
VIFCGKNLLVCFKKKQDFFEKFPKQLSHLEEESYEIAKIFGRF